jgi:hypothetical protein
MSGGDSKTDLAGMDVNISSTSSPTTIVGETNEPLQDGNEIINERASHMFDFRDVDNAQDRSLKRDILDSFNTFRFNSGMFVNDSRIQLAIIVLISINAIMMGISTYPIVRENDDVNQVFETIDKIFLITFTVELSLQFVYLGSRLFLDGWLLFDFIIIVTSWSFAEVQIVRAFRIFRALRLATRVKIMRNLLLGTLISRSNIRLLSTYKSYKYTYFQLCLALYQEWQLLG